MYILIALFVGFLAAIPIGPINVFAITQTLRRDFLHGFLVGLTAAFLDVIFCMAAITGMHELTTSIEVLLPTIKILGIIIILLLAGRLYYQSRHCDIHKKNEQNRISTAPRPIIGAILLYIANPGLYMFWIAVGGTVTAHKLISPLEWNGLIFAVTSGVGTTIWYFLLCRYVAKYHHQFEQKTFERILLVTALILVALALYTAVTLII